MCRVDINNGRYKASEFQFLVVQLISTCCPSSPLGSSKSGEFCTASAGSSVKVLNQSIISQSITCCDWLLWLQYLFAGEHMNLTAMMNTWTLQKGVPLVTVAREGSRLLLRQERFLKTVLPSDPVWATLQRG